MIMTNKVFEKMEEELDADLGPVFPIEMKSDVKKVRYTGLTAREMSIGFALQGLLAGGDVNRHNIPGVAIEMADALIEKIKEEEDGTKKTKSDN